jgi:ubiquinone/menaquinone biosynthesis C-methylase UbiE
MNAMRIFQKRSPWLIQAVARGRSLPATRKRKFLAAVALVMAMAAAAVLAAKAAPFSGPLVAPLQAAKPSNQSLLSQPAYETRKVHDPNGTGKFYMGREIAQVMGPGGIPWLDRQQREDEEKPALVMDALGLRQGEIVADLGAGSGYFTFRIAPRIGPGGKVLAVEIQDEMIETLRQRAAEQKITNVEVVKGSDRDPNLPANGVDLVLMVDVYHELAYPFEVMTRVRKALKPGGRVVFVEYRQEDPQVPIKEVHKMSVAQLEKEMKAVGFTHLRTVETLPLQHIVIFERHD